MAVEFERSRLVVVGRTVTVTSWCNDTTNTWHASAPSHCHLLSAEESAEIASPSRAQAIERVVRQLKASFEARG